MTSAVRVTLPLTLLTLCCCVALTLALDGLWFGSMPDVVDTTTPYPLEAKTSRVSSVNAKRRPPTSTSSSSIKAGNVTLTKQRVASIRRRVNASAPTTSTSSTASNSAQRVKNVSATNRTLPPSQGTKMEEVTYWETDSVGGSDSAHSNHSDEVSVKEHDRSPHPGSFSGGSGGGGAWFGRFKGPSSSSSSADQAEAVSVAGYQSSGEPEATVQIKEHDELGVGAGAHFSFSPGADESALWFGGSSSGGAENAKPETSSSSSSGGGGGGSESGAWFGLDNWAPLSLDSSANHRQQRRLRTPEVEKGDDIITAPPPSARDTFSFVVNSNLGGGEGEETTIAPTWDFEEEAIITAEPSVVEDSWFEDQEETTSVTPSSTTTTTTTTTAKPIVVTKSKSNNSYIVGISKVSRVNEQRSIIDFIDEDEEIVNVSQNYITMPLTTSTPAPTAPETVTHSRTEETTVPVTEHQAEATTEGPSIFSELELFFALENQTNIVKTNYTTAKPANESLPMREGREFDNVNHFVNVNDNSEKINLTKSAVMTSSNVPKVLKSGPLASNSQVPLNNRDNTAYIIVGTCCAVSLLCLVVVVAILRYRKSVRRRRRQNPFHHYPMDRDPRFFHFEPHSSSSWVDQQQPPGAILQGHKILPPGPPPHHHHQFNAPPSAPAAHPKTRNLWFIGQKRSAPYSLCEPHHESGAAVTSGPPPSYRANSHSSGLDSMSKGQLIYWSSNSERLI